MWKLLKIDLQRLVHDVPFKLALFVSAGLGLWCLFINIQRHYLSLEALQNESIAYSYPYSVYNACISADGVTLPSTLLFALLPLLATLPYGASFAQDIRTGYLKNLTVKVPRREIFISRYLAVFIGAFSLVIFATTGQMIFSMMFLPVLPPEIASFSFPIMSVGHVGHVFYAQHPFLYLLFYNLYDAVLLAAFSTVSIFVACRFKNAFISLIGPTAFFYALSYIFDLLGLTIFRPDCIITPYAGITLSASVMLLEVVAMVLCSIALCFICLARDQDVF